MKLGTFFQRSIDAGIDSDVRGRDGILSEIAKLEKKYQALSIRDKQWFFVVSLYFVWVNHMKCTSGAQNFPQEISVRAFDDG